MRKIFNRYTIYACLLSHGLAGCAGNNPGTPASQKRKPHLAEIKMAGAVVYIDEVDNRMVMDKKGSSPGTSVFRSYLIGMEEGEPGDGKMEIASRRYFEYDLPHDWKLLLNGDSIAPVFFQPKPLLNGRLMEGVMVFEVPGDRIPDSLVYADGSGSRGRQLIILHTHKK
jgi:hypothetical protein